MTKLIYIIGAGRSGSTLLDIVLGACPGVQGNGEMINLANALLDCELCSCGVQIGDCPFWSRVIARWREQVSLDDEELRRFARLDRYYGHIRHPGAWMAALCPRLSQNYIWYIERLGALLNVTAEISGAEIISDSSKSPLRLLALARAWSGPLTVIHLVKDPRQVVASLAKSYAPDKARGIQRAIPGRAPVRTALWWVLVNAAANWTIRRAGVTSRRVRYEDLTADPGAVTEALVDRRPDPAFNRFHICAGNRMRMGLKSGWSVWAASPPPKIDPLPRWILKRAARKFGYVL